MVPDPSRLLCSPRVTSQAPGLGLAPSSLSALHAQAMDCWDLSIPHPLPTLPPTGQLQTVGYVCALGWGPAGSPDTQISAPDCRSQCPWDQPQSTHPDLGGHLVWRSSDPHSREGVCSCFVQCWEDRAVKPGSCPCEWTIHTTLVVHPTSQCWLVMGKQRRGPLCPCRRVKSLHLAFGITIFKLCGELQCHLQWGCACSPPL